MFDRKKVLVLGLGLFQVSSIQKIKEQGYFVIGLDSNPYSEGISLCDEYHQLDRFEMWEIIKLLEKTNNLDILRCVSFCSDAAFLPMVEINRHLGIPTMPLETAELSVNKNLQRERLFEKNLNNSFFYKVHDVDSVKGKFQFPLIVKPVDSSGSRGVNVVINETELKTAINKALSASNSKECLIEQLIIGREYTFDGFYIEEEVVVLAIAEKFKPLGSLTVSKELLYWSENAVNLEQSFKELIGKYLKGIKNNFIFHAEIILENKSQSPYLVELSFRSGGFGIYDKILPRVSGVDVVSVGLNLLMGLTIPKFEVDRESAMLNFVLSSPGKLESVDISNKLMSEIPTNSFEVNYLKELGTIFGAVESDSDRFAAIYTYGKDWKEALSISKQIEYSINLSVSPC
jgi:biotin carboxylase